MSPNNVTATLIGTCESEVFMQDTPSDGYDVSSFDAMPDIDESQSDSDENIHILVIEDNDILNETLVSHLEMNGYTVSFTNNGEGGIALARTIQPDVILTDYIMEGLHGKELLRDLRTHPLTRHIPIIIMSGYDIHNDELAGILFLYKPFNFNDIHAALRHVAKTSSKIHYDG